MVRIDRPRTPAVQKASERLRSRANVARAIISARMKLKISQDEIAKQAGTKQSRISELETLSGNVRFDTLDRIASALGLEVDLRPRPVPFATLAADGGRERGVYHIRDSSDLETELKVVDRPYKVA